MGSSRAVGDFRTARGNGVSLSLVDSRAGRGKPKEGGGNEGVAHLELT